MEILRIEDLTFAYPSCEKNAVDGVSLSVNEGEFIVLCGASGCGKTTLLKLLKKELSPAGKKSGKIFFRGGDAEKLSDRESASEIGFVMQNPEEQIVTDKVWHELSYGLENLGVPSEVIRRRVGEIAGWFGLTDFFRKNTDELSGGQKQLLNLASVAVMQPKLLLLDEPTGQLDPIAASEFISMLKKLNREFGLTVILAEHRLEEVFPVADRAAVMENGKLLLCSPPRAVGKELSAIDKDHPMLLALPSAVRICSAVEGVSDVCPLTVREGRDFLEKNFAPSSAETPAHSPVRTSPDADTVPAVEMKKVRFRYDRDLPDILRGTDLKVYPNEIFCVLGGNGTGKTTALNVIAGLDRPYRGKVLINGVPTTKFGGNSLYRSNLALLPQDPQTVFVRDEVGKDLSEITETLGLSEKEWEERVARIAEKVGITHLLKKHPLDLSGGEQQKCALAKCLLSEPKILLLDEPTKGLDARSKASLAALLKELKNGGMTVLTVTHDVEFAAENADRCALFFDGEILSSDVPSRFFSENNFYTTSSSRMARRIWREDVTCAEVVAHCRASVRSERGKHE